MTAEARVVSRSESRALLAELFEIAMDVNDRLPAPFDVGRIKVALVCHYLFSGAGHQCQGGTQCSRAIEGYYRRVRATDAEQGRAKRIDRLFNGVLGAGEGSP